MTTSIPKFELSRDEQVPNAPPSDANKVAIPTELTFAQEVRSERLGLLWKITLFTSLLFFWILVVLSGGRSSAGSLMLVPTAILALGSVLSGQLLKHNYFNAAVWAFAIGSVIATGSMMGYGSDFAKEYAAFVFPLLIFVLGLLVPVRTTLLFTGLMIGVGLGLPTFAEKSLEISNATIFALALTLIAAALSAQVSGELFAIAEWALENYRKERRTTFALFESREALEKSLHRQRFLTLQVQETNLELEDARKSAEEAKNFRGQFLANMSHELRTPLNAIIGFSQTMLDFPAMYDGVELPNQYRQDMNQILSSGKHLLTIINDILDLSKVDAGKLDLELQPVDLAPIIKGVLSTAVGLIGDKARQVQLTKELPEPLPMVMGDPLRVRQVLLNLYSNAAKFTDSGYIKLKVHAENNEVIFGVEDTGIGIPDSDKASIFEEFRQGTAGRKKGRQGAGLGLAISQQLLRLMNGRIWFESTLGKGTTFYIALPLHVPSGEVVPETPEKTAEPVIAPKPAPKVTAPIVADPTK